MAPSAAIDLVASLGLEPTKEQIDRADDYLGLARKARWFGLVCGVLTGIGPVAGESDHSLIIPRLFAGYLFGVLLGELLVSRGSPSPVRVASLRARRARQLVPSFALFLPWFLLTPLLFAPLLALGDHPRGVSRLRSAGSDCFGRAYWPHTATLIAIAALAAAGLLLFGLAIRRATVRPHSGQDNASLDLDRALRGRSARGAVASASAMGLVLLGVLGQYLDDGIHSYICAPGLAHYSGTTGNVYSWADSVSPWLQDVSIGLIILAIPTWAVCRRLRLPTRDDQDA